MRGEARIINGADAGDAAVAISVATSLGIRIPEVAAGVSGVTGPAAAYALSQGEASIRNIDQCGLLESLLPELTECRNLIPDDSVHAYTVFEHSLRLVRVIENFKPGSWLFNVRESSLDLEHLILAALLHDIGKQIDDERHSEIGADMATEILTRWRVSDNMIRQVSWMIRNHLAISHVLRFRDLADPATIHEFAELVQNRERLGLLTILAYADISSVAPGVMTPALEGAFEELYFRTLDLLETAALMPQEKQRRRLTEELQKEPVTDEVVEDFVSGLPVHYLNSTPIERTRDHIHMVERARNGEIVIETRSQPDQGATEFTVCCHDAPGLLSRILGCFYALDLRVQQIRICTTATERIALDTFLVNFSNRALAKATADLAMSQLRGVLDGSQAVEDLLTKNGKDPTREQRVLNYRFIEGNPGILEIRAPRGRGLPYRLCRWIATQGWNITSARMGQWAENASAAVYLTRGDGGELTAQEVDAAFEQRQTL